jgi:hypothetical protein
LQTAYCTPKWFPSHVSESIQNVNPWWFTFVSFWKRPAASRLLISAGNWSASVDRRQEGATGYGYNRFVFSGNANADSSAGNKIAHKIFLIIRLALISHDG